MGGGRGGSGAMVLLLSDVVEPEYPLAQYFLDSSFSNFRPVSIKLIQYIVVVIIKFIQLKFVIF